MLYWLCRLIHQFGEQVPFRNFSKKRKFRFETLVKKERMNDEQAQLTLRKFRFETLVKKEE